MTGNRAKHVQEAIDSAGLYYTRCLFHNFPMVGEHALARHHVCLYLDI